ncbi:hypothetical protein [Granulicella sp. L46]|uniref:hypothetical protein n=1 Tax=Granulicella sp. L46 TaxID=1641865 RepID=UPI002738EAB4|nr:hypothetical protein [Granulicella sp. L46]
MFTLQSVEGRLFKPVAWTVAFAPLCSLILSTGLAPVLASFLFPNGATEWENPTHAHRQGVSRTRHRQPQGLRPRSRHR